MRYLRYWCCNTAAAKMETDLRCMSAHIGSKAD